MFEVDVKNVTEEQRGPARVWGFDWDGRYQISGDRVIVHRMTGYLWFVVVNIISTKYWYSCGGSISFGSKHLHGQYS